MAEHIAPETPDKFERIVFPVQEYQEVLENGPNPVFSPSDIPVGLKEKREITEKGRRGCGSMEGKEDVEENEVVILYEARNRTNCEGRTGVCVAGEKNWESVSGDEKGQKEGLSRVKEIQEMVESMTVFDSEIDSKKIGACQGSLASFSGGRNEIAVFVPEISSEFQEVGSMPRRPISQSCLLDSGKSQETVQCDGERMDGNKGCENQLANFSKPVEEEESMGFSGALAPKAGKCGLKNVEKEMVEHEEEIARSKKHGPETIHMQNESRLDSEFQGLIEKGYRRRYSRCELEELRFLNIEEQQTRWNEIYLGLGPVLAQERDKISMSMHQKQDHKNSNQRKCSGKKKKAAKVLDEVHFENLESIEEVNSFDPASGYYLNLSKESCSVVEVFDEDKNSDDEHDSIQRPAFLVEGEPDFESGPPQDGLEYLRRVRWEAAQMPKVKVAKLDKNKLNKEQTAYMPNIPDFAKCPEHLLPSKCWQDSFLAEFAELRQALSQLEGSSMGSSLGESSVIFVHEDSTKIPEHVLSPKSSPNVSVILGMDIVTRASMLRNRISLLETGASLSRGDCLWLFALCAGIDVPVDAETSASLRCLLRKCASLLAKKSEPDDEVIMLNMLVTIAGRYFGQSEQ